MSKPHKKKRGAYDLIHPELGRIYFTNHLITRCLERVFDVKRADADYEVRGQAKAWLRGGITKGKVLGWFMRTGTTATITTETQPAIRVGDFVVVFTVTRSKVYAAQTIFPVNEVG